MEKLSLDLFKVNIFSYIKKRQKNIIYSIYKTLFVTKSIRLFVKINILF